jgi:hypothetical protein
MITKLYIGRVGRYYPETRYYAKGTDVPAVAAVPFTEYDFADEADVPADGDFVDPDGAYRPEEAGNDQRDPTPMEQRQAVQDALAAEAAANVAAGEPASNEPPGPVAGDEPPAADPPAVAVRSRQAGAPDPEPTAPATAGQEG